MKFWQQKMAGTGLDQVSAGGMGSGSSEADRMDPSAKAEESILPGSAVSAQLVRGDMESPQPAPSRMSIPNNCWPADIRFCRPDSFAPNDYGGSGDHPASPLNAFKIINTGANIGAFTEDRDAGVRGVLGMRAAISDAYYVRQARGHAQAQRGNTRFAGFDAAGHGGGALPILAAVKRQTQHHHISLHRQHRH